MLATWGCTTFPKPTLSLDFLGATSLDSGITFSRGSQATLFDSAGTLKYAKHNLALQSQDFTTSWVNVGTTDTANTSVAPDGTTTADTLTEDSATSIHVISQTVAIAGTVTLSVFAKLGSGARFLTIGFNRDTANTASATFDLSLGTNTQTQANGGIYASPSATITAVAQGFYRCTFTVATDTVTSIRIGLNNTGTPTANNRAFGVDYTGDNTSSLIIWGAQLNLANMEGGVTSSLTTYYPTTTAAYYAPRFDYNPSTLAPLGLLIEEARTNIVLNSGDFSNASFAKGNVTVTGSSITAPDGTTTGTLFDDDTAAGTHSCATAQQTLVSGTTYTLSVFAKNGDRNFITLAVSAGTNTWAAAKFDLSNGTVGSTSQSGSGWSATSGSITNVGGGWFRCSLTYVPGSTGVTLRFGLATDGTTYTAGERGLESYTGSDKTVYLWGGQHEIGAFITSYIPTTTTALTRNADVASMTGTNFSSWYNQSEGTVFGQFLRTASANSVQGRVFSLSDGSNNAVIEIYQTGATNPAAQIGNSGSQAQWTPTGFTVGLPIKEILAYKLNDSNASFNGSAETPDTVCTIPTLNQAQIGNRWDNIRNLNGYVQRLAYYPTRLPNATLQALTA